MTVDDFYHKYARTLALHQLVSRGAGDISLTDPQQIFYIDKVGVPLELPTGVDCLVVQKACLDDYLKSVCHSQGIALFTSAFNDAEFKHGLRECLIALNPKCVARYGTFVKVCDQGILIRGESGSGKSDLALGLVDRGHQLIADDQVEFSVVDGRLIGCCPSGFLGYTEIRGLGVINVIDLYGDKAVRESSSLDLVVTLGYEDMRHEERIHGIYGDWQLQGVSVPELLIPYSVSRNMPLIIEVAARVNRLRRQGYDAAADFEAAVARLMQQENA